MANILLVDSKYYITLIHPAIQGVYSYLIKHVLAISWHAPSLK